MDSGLRRGDRVRRNDGRHGVLERVYVDSVAMVYWEDQGSPSYERATQLFKVKPVSERRAPVQRESKASERESEDEWSN